MAPAARGGIPVPTRIPASERTSQKLEELLTQDVAQGDARTELLKLAVRKIVEEALEAEVAEAVGRGYYARTVWTVLLKRRVWATMARTPLADTKLAMCRAAARLVARGFSTSRGLPARHAASTMAGWSIGGTATTTASTRGLATRSR